MGVCCSCACWKTCCVSKWELEYRDNYHMHEEEFRALRFEMNETREVYRVFKTIDKRGLGKCTTAQSAYKSWSCFLYNLTFENAGWISYQKILKYCKINETPFIKSLFTVFDKRKTGHVCFRDFFMIIYDYCTLAPTQLGVLLCGNV